MAGQYLLQRLSGMLGHALAHYLSRPLRGYEPFAITDSAKLAHMLEPADVLLVEGNHSSGDPTRAICSGLIAQAFQSVRYPILPHIERHTVAGQRDNYKVREILHIRHYCLFAPRDFDISPFFQVIKPEVEDGFPYRDLIWVHQPDADDEEGHGRKPRDDPAGNELRRSAR